MSSYRSPNDVSSRASRYLSTHGENPAASAVVLSTIGASCTVSAVNSGLFSLLRPRFDLVVTGLLWVVGGQAGNYDIGLYDDAGTRLWAKGATTVPASGTTVTEAFTGVPLRGGTEYYVGWSSDNTTAAVKGLAIAGVSELGKLVDGSLPVYSVASVFPLPSTVTYGTTAVNRLPFFVVRGT